MIALLYIVLCLAVAWFAVSLFMTMYYYLPDEATLDQIITYFFVWPLFYYVLIVERIMMRISKHD